MAEQTPETLSHFTIVSFTPEFARLPEEARRSRMTEWLAELRGVADVVHAYQLTGFEAGGELLLWSACRSAEPGRVDAFFRDWARVLAPMRNIVQIRDVLWGLTRSSPYTKARSTQELDPFAPTRGRFLVVYPFIKSAEWYGLPRERRQEMMAGHIRVGTGYKEITQLLLYSFGLQDQEFVVVYEVDDLRRFSALVHDLRGTEARPYTVRDWPLHVGRHCPSAESLAAWL